MPSLFTFVQSHWPFVLHQRAEDVFESAGISAFRCSLQATFQHVLWHSDCPVCDTGCEK